MKFLNSGMERQSIKYIGGVKVSTGTQKYKLHRLVDRQASIKVDQSLLIGEVSTLALAA